MADVFVSCKREDETAVSRLVDALRGSKFDVWWDVDIAAGAPWEETIEAQLANASAVVVVWSRTATESENVKAEARWARARGRLLQVFIEECEPPLSFGERQGVNLRRWSGSQADKAFIALSDAIRDVVVVQGGPRDRADRLSGPSASRGASSRAGPASERVDGGIAAGLARRRESGSASGEGASARPDRKAARHGSYRGAN
jgi:hypothetical protein